MDVKILDEKENALLSRREVTAEISYTGATPKTEDVAKAMSQNLKAEEKLVVIKNINQKFGIQKSKILAYQYMNEEDKIKYEPKKKEKKGAKKPAEGAEEAPAAKEAPKEQKKEEKKEAPKKEEPKAEKKEAKDSPAKKKEAPKEAKTEKK